MPWHDDDYDRYDDRHHPKCPAQDAGPCECAELAAQDYDDAMDARVDAYRDRLYND